MSLAWITGASSGIGEALARRLAGERRTIAASARNAGTHRPTSPRAFTVESVRALVETNLMGVVKCPAPTLARMHRRRAGQVAGLASKRFEITFPAHFAFMLKALDALPYRLYFRVLRGATGR